MGNERQRRHAFEHLLETHLALQQMLAFVTDFFPPQRCGYQPVDNRQTGRSIAVRRHTSGFILCTSMS